MELGFGRREIETRLATGRLHAVDRGVYAVGRPQLGWNGRRVAATLGCGAGAVLSHRSAGAVWGVCEDVREEIHVTVPYASPRRRPGVVVHRRPRIPESEKTVRGGIPTTKPLSTLIDLATIMSRHDLVRAIDEADRLDITTPIGLLEALDDYPARRGVGVLKRLLRQQVFRLTDSELERRFLRLVAEAKLPPPVTQTVVSGFRVDFFWPELGMVVETDGLRYHRTPAQQTRDRERDQAHTAAGLTQLRFTHAQIRYEGGRVLATLQTVMKRLERTGGHE